MRQLGLVLLCCLSGVGCVSHRGNHPRQALANDDLSLYRITNDQAGHEWVKTEQFLVPVGATIVINGLKFEPRTSTLTQMHKRIVQEIFNCIEEITENTVGDTNSTRVAEFKKMEFEIRGYPDGGSQLEADRALAEERASGVLDFLTYLGTPPWRLKASGINPKGSASSSAAKDRNMLGTVEFIRTR